MAQVLFYFTLLTVNLFYIPQIWNHGALMDIDWFLKVYPVNITISQYCFWAIVPLTKFQTTYEITNLDSKGIVIKVESYRYAPFDPVQYPFLSAAAVTMAANLLI